MTADTKKYKILVVEDNPGDFLLVEDFLLEKIAAPEILNATSFKAAGELLVLHKLACFDIVLLDLSLPDKTGAKLIEDIIRICGDIPVIVLTGYVDFNFSVQSLALGVADYILKEDLTATSLYKSIVYSLERKKTDAELRRSEKKYSELFHLSPLPMWVYEISSLKFLDVNDAAVKNYGYEHHEFLCMTIKDIRPAEDILKLSEVLEKSRPEFTEQGIFRHKKKNGDIIEVDIKSNIIDYKGVAAKVIIAYDLTDQLNHLKAIEEKNTKLKDIAWMQSHVIRAPLARIMGLVHLIKDIALNSAEQEEILGYIMVSANDLDGVIKEISDTTKG